VLTSLQQQNAVAPSGIVQAGPETDEPRVSGRFTSVESLRAVNIRVNDRFFRLTDVATITRGYVEPAAAHDIDAAEEHGVAVVSVPNYGTQEVA